MSPLHILRLASDPGDREEELNKRSMILRRLLLGLIITLLLVTSVASLIGIILIRQTQQDGSPTQQRLIDLGEQIKSCTTPEGECAKRNAEATAEVVATLITGNSEATREIVSAALSCQADGITEKRALLDCTVERSK